MVGIAMYAMASYAISRMVEIRPTVISLYNVEIDSDIRLAFRHYNATETAVSMN